MESTIKKKINTFGKAGKIITSIIIVVLLVVEGFLLAGTIVAAVLPMDSVSVDAQGGGTVRFDAEYFGFDSDELSLNIGSTQIKLAEFDSVKTHSQDGSVIMDVQSGEFHFNLNTLLGLMIIGIIRLASFVVALYFLKALMKAFMTCETPFCGNVIKKMRAFAIALIPSMIVSSMTNSVLGLLFTDSISIGGGGFDMIPVLFVFVVFILTAIFRYGAQLQKEYDETV